MKARQSIVVVTAVALLALAVPAVLLPVLVLGLGNTSWGRHALEIATDRLTGGGVLVIGLAGQFPEYLRAARVELRDDRGTWATADDVHVHWSPSQLLHRDIHLDLLQAARVHLSRTPQARASSRDHDSRWPARIGIDRIELARVEMEAPLAGAPAVVSIQGGADIAWPREGTAELRIQRTDAAGTGTLKGWINPSAMQADITVDEPAHGLLAGFAGLGDVGTVSAQLHLQGARDAPELQSTLAAGALRARASGKLSWTAQTLDVDIQGSAPEMTPRQGLHWQGVTLQAHVHGPFRRPDATAQLRIDGLEAAGAQVRRLHADAQGNGGMIDVHAVAERVRIPGPVPDLLQGAPLDLRANVRLGDTTRAATFTLSHPVASVQGNAHLTAGVQADFTVTVPQLAPLSALAGIDLQGRTALTVKVAQQGRTTQVGATGTVDVTGGSALVQGLIGSAAQLDVAFAVRAGDVEVRMARLASANLQASVTGSAGSGPMDLHWHAAIARLAALSPALSGDVDANGHLEEDRQAQPRGKGPTLRLEADARGNLGTRGFAARPIAASVRVRGLPDAPVGNIDAQGTLEDAPLAVAAVLARNSEGKVRVTIEHADWKSAHAQGELLLRSGEAMPDGQLQLQIARLADLAPWIDPRLQGSGVASVKLAPTGHGRATIEADMHDLSLAGSRADHLHASGTIDDPVGHAMLSGQLRLEGLAANGVQGNATLGVQGPLPALALGLTADLRAEDNSPAHIDAHAVFDTDRRLLDLGTLRAQYRGTSISLLAPAQIAFRDGVALDRLRIGVAGSVVELAGRIEPTLDMTASVRDDASAANGAPSRGARVKGALAIDARLTGNPARFAMIDAKIAFGAQAQLTASGRLPFSANEPLDIRAKGTIDAAIGNSILASTGRRLRGRLAVDIGAAGTLHAPQINGTLHLADGDFEDDNLGMHLTGIDALIVGSGTSLQISRLTAQAGPGTLAMTGTIGPLEGELPVKLRLTAHNAQPLASDFVTANIDADIRLRGTVPARLDVGGTVRINRADVTIPSALPPSVGVLDVRRPGQAPVPPGAASATVIGLDLKVDAPSAVFVRGRGIDAEMGGTLTIAGTSAAPQVGGGFDMRRGSFDLAGSTLTFVSGRLGFNGTGLNRKIDPTLDFAAQSQSTSFTARLDVTGYADAPKISLSSTPAMPQDEILAQLLFGTSVNKLTALQIVQIGSAIATIGGVGFAGGSTLSTVQKSLGLDRLSVGNTPTGATSVEAGRYVTKGVFVGARQMGAAGGTTQALVQIDLTKQLKAVGAFGNGGSVQGATPDNDPGNSIGLLYQIEY